MSKLLVLLATALAGVAVFSVMNPEPLTAAERPPADQAALGARLFHDPILSRDRRISCAGCHKPQHAYADTVAFSPGIDGHLTHRNVPSVMNVRGRVGGFFWDGRAATLEEQALQPIINPEEMNLSIDEAVRRLTAHPDYSVWFRSIFGRAPDAAALAEALAAFQRRLETADSAYDRYLGGDRTTLSPAAMRGRDLFRGKALCLSCHHGEDFNSPRARNIGLYDGGRLNDQGREAVTGDPADRGLFVVPGLRNVAVTAPYMHNGMFATLREVIDYYDDPSQFGIASINRDPLLDARLNLTEQEKQDLEAFLHALTDRRFLPPTGVPSSQNGSKPS